VRRALSVIALSVLLPGCQPSEPAANYRRLTSNDYCLTLRVYAQPDAKHYVGFLQGEAPVPDRGQLVEAINIEADVDGHDTSVWRRESDVLQWYVRAEDVPRNACRWFKYPKAYEPGRLEIPLDRTLWLRLAGGWTTRKPLFQRFAI
jgi:hypothetical protein